MIRPPPHHRKRASNTRPYEPCVMNIRIVVTHINTARKGDFTRRKPDFTLPQAGFHLTAGQISLGL